MNIDAYAAAKANAVNEIGEKLKIDLSTSSLPKASEPKILELFRLQKIARESSRVDEDSYILEEILLKIENTKGVGPALYEKIEKSLRE